MTKIYNNIEYGDHAAYPAATISGFFSTPAYDAARIRQITDTVGAGLAINKMGTSIPTPFARMLVFDTAFSQISNQHNEDTVYDRLVSECLDMLEFFFTYGHDVSWKVWNIDVRVQSLKNSHSSGHQILGASIERFARDLQIRDIYLFYYQNKLVGGTSPYTLVYTSPNWQRSCNGLNLRGLNGNTLFPDYSDRNITPCHLHHRHEDFRRFLTDMMIAFNHINRFSNSFLRRYIYDNLNLDPVAHNHYNAHANRIPVYNVADFLNDYDMFDDPTAGQIDVFGMGGGNTMFLAHKSIRPDGNDLNVSDDYQLVPTVERYRALTMDHVPLVLTEVGNPSALYIGGQPWDRNTLIVRNSSQALNERILPGPGAIRYPYLTDADFFEDKLIKLAYEVDEKSFKMLGGSTKYLLPLKKELFDYFNINDFGSKLELLCQETGNKVIYTLKLPIKCKSVPYIQLRKEYGDTDIIDASTEPIGFAVFPSYKLNDGRDRYAVLLHNVNGIDCLSETYWKMSAGAVEQVTNNQMESSQTSVRILDTVQSDFDFICFNYAGRDGNCVGKAMIIPNFKVVIPRGNNAPVVAIDFGTTNTYVALSYDDGALPFELDETINERQLLVMNPVDLSEGMGSDSYKSSFSAVALTDFQMAIEREFVPLLIGCGGANAKFPHRTVTFDSGQFGRVPAPHLFGHTNVGFNYLYETIDVSVIGAEYNPNVKWALESTNVSQTDVARVNLFCLEIAWIIKNKLALGQNPNLNLTVYITYPYKMSTLVRGQMIGYWRSAFDTLMGNGAVNIIPMTESIAPFYYLIGNGGRFTQNALNIDIGGGTTDMLFADVENRAFWFDSSMFAGNDIWGDGLSLVPQLGKDNGFVTLFEVMTRNGGIVVDEDIMQKYDYLERNAKSSSDLMSFIFQFEDRLHFSQTIRTNSRMCVLFVHLGALLYHVSQVLKAKGMTMPTTITFSGMGSKYIELIAADSNDLTALVKGILAEFMGYGFGDRNQRMPQNFSVRVQSNGKEVTAKGAMLQNNPNVSAWNQYSKEGFQIYGFDNAPERLNYGDGTADVPGVNTVKDSAKSEFENFVNAYLRSPTITAFLRQEYGVIFDTQFIESILRNAEGGFDVMAQKQGGDIEVRETLFFWFLKNGLYEASKLIR